MGPIFVWRGVILGLGAAAPIGPVNVEMARRTLRSGFAAGFALGCGAVSVDVVYAVLSSLALEPAANHPVAARLLGLAGGVFLGYLGLMSLKSALGSGHGAPSGHAPSGRSRLAIHAGNYLTGVAMTSLNPMTLVFWFSAVATITGHLRQQVGAVCLGVVCGALGWSLTFSGAMSLLGRAGRRQWLRLADLCGGLTLLVFAGAAIWQAGREFLR